MPIGQPLQFVSHSLPPAEVGQPYHGVIETVGGQGPSQGMPLDWHLPRGSLPPGLNGPDPLHPAAAEIHGTPTAAGSFDFTVEAHDGPTGQTAVADFTIPVEYPPAPPQHWPTLGDLKAWLRIPDDTEDELLARVLEASIEAIQERCGQYWDEDEVPITVAKATVMHAARLYKRRDSLDGTIGLPDVGMLRVGRFDADIDGLLYPWRVVRLA